MFNKLTVNLGSNATAPVIKKRLKKTPESIFINSNEGSVTVPRDWHLRCVNKTDASIFNENGILKLSLTGSGKPVFLCQNPTQFNFQKLKLNEGMLVNHKGVYLFSVHGNCSSSIAFQASILEFDIEGKRIGIESFKLNNICTYKPNLAVSRVILILRLEGKGDCFIEKVQLETGVIGEKNPILSAVKAGATDQFNTSTANVGNTLNKSLCQLAEQIPQSNGTQFYSKIPLKVGIITDLYMFNFYKDVFEKIVYLTPDNYQSELNEPLDIIMYVSGWEGINNEEWKGIKYREKPKTAFENIITHAKNENIKTVFQTIEDPSNFDYFLPLAKQFDYIFTSDSDCIEKYKDECGHTNVYYGEYGVNPIFNNPIGCRNNIFNSSFFAGSYPKRYQERCNDMEVVFDSIIDSTGELVIADRNLHLKNEDLAFPARYQGTIMPAVPHKTLQSMHKLFRFNLNFNSIKASPTMCAMRVYELQAQGSGLISNYANSIFNQFPEVRIIPFKENLSLELEKEADLDEYKNNMDCIRNVITNKTSYHVVSSLVEKIGFSVHLENEPCICVITKTNKTHLGFDKQSYSNKLFLSEEELIERWDELQAQHKIEYFTWFDDSYDYEKDYLTDLLNAFKYTDSTFITKDGYFNDKEYIAGVEHDYVNSFNGINKTLFKADNLNPNDFSNYGLADKVDFDNGYSIDPFQLNYNKYLTNNITDPKSFKYTVIVPVYNNGRFLETKCIPSLKRNETFDEMEIILVDDGSPNQSSIDICKKLELTHGNISCFFFNDGGSGSASRPRNKGIELATTDCITFLDPDNEICPKGYDVLFKLYDENEDLDFVSGYHVKVTEVSTIIGKHTDESLYLIDNPKERFFNNGKFPVVSTQAGLINKKLFDDPSFRFVERSAGQDSLFGWELLCRAKKGAFTASSYLIYYAERDDSVTNMVDSNYFSKKLILEEAQVKILKKFDIYEYYKKFHLVHFLTNWYLIKLKVTPIEERRNSIEIIQKVHVLYGESLESLGYKSLLEELK